MTSKHAASPLREAAVKGLTGLLVGFMIFFFLWAFRGVPVVGPLLVHLQMIGVDLGLYAESFIHRSAQTGQGPVQYNYVFLDVDPRACAVWHKQQSDQTSDQEHDPVCSPTAPAEREIVADLVSAAREAGALVVVLDIATIWPGPSGSDPLAAALKMPDNGDVGPTPVVLPLMFDMEPGWDPALERAGPTIRPARGWSGPDVSARDCNVFFGLPFASSHDDPLGGDTVRAYARAIEGDAMATGTDPKPYWTLAGVTACLAEHYNNPAACQEPLVATASEWIRYTVPPIIPGLDADSRAKWVLGKTVRYLSASNELPPKGHALAAMAALKHAIVIIGSSRDARDYHPTPLGVMTGAEVMLNAVRSMLEFRQPTNTGWTDALLAECKVLIPTAVLFTVFWWFASWLAGQFAANRGLSWRIAIGTVLVAGFVLTCVIAVGLAALIVLWAIELQTETHWDLVTPVMIALLEGTVEGMHQVITPAEKSIGFGLDKAGHFFVGWWTRRPVRPD
jgi:hypothetical protein